MKRQIWLAASVLLGSTTLAACGAAPAAMSHAGPAVAQASAQRSLSVAVRPEIKTAGYRTQEVVTPYTAADVDHVTLTVTDASGNVTASATVPQAEIGQVVTLTNLAPNTTYTILCQAFDVDGNQISVDAQSQTTVTVADDDVLAPITLTVQLQDVVFSGVATGTINVVDGTVLPPSGPVTISVIAPVPDPSPAATDSPAP